MKLFRRRKSRCERRGRHEYGPFMRSHPVCVDCGYVDPPPECWHCHRGTFCEPEPIFGTLCCDACGRSVMDTPDEPDGMPSCLPSFDNAGSIPLTDEQRARIAAQKRDGAA